MSIQSPFPAESAASPLPKADAGGPTTSCSQRALAFTLTETLISVFLGAIMLTALYSSFTCGFATIRLAREDLRATQIMLKTMESIRLYSFDQITNATYYPTASDSYDPQDQASGGGGATYAVSFSSTAPAAGSFPNSYLADMRLISVTVYWTNRCGSASSNLLVHSRNMQTYVARNGIENYVSKGQ